MSNLTKITFFSLLNKLAFRIANQNKLKIEFSPPFFMINLMFSQHLLHVKFNQITCFNLKKTGPKYNQLWLIGAEIVAKDQGQILVRAKSSPPKKNAYSIWAHESWCQLDQLYASTLKVSSHAKPSQTLSSPILYNSPQSSQVTVC